MVWTSTGVGHVRPGLWRWREATPCRQTQARTASAGLIGGVTGPTGAGAGVAAAGHPRLAGRS